MFSSMTNPAPPKNKFINVVSKINLLICVWGYHHTCNCLVDSHVCRNTHRSQHVICSLSHSYLLKFDRSIVQQVFVATSIRHVVIERQGICWFPDQAYDVYILLLASLCRQRSFLSGLRLSRTSSSIRQYCSRRRELSNSSPASSVSYFL